MSYALVAHVKWFTERQALPPLPWPEVFSPVFLFWAAASLGAMLVLTYHNDALHRLGWVRRIHAVLDRFQPWTPWFIRAGAAFALLAAANAGTLLALELSLGEAGLPRPAAAALRAVEAASGAAFLVPALNRLAGAGLVAVYLFGVALFGLHAMLDYAFALGVAYVGLTQGTRLARAQLPVLYATTGFSLAWLAMEKWVFPGMAVDIIRRRDLFTFGFDPYHFTMIAGWIEFSVGYLLVSGVLSRFLSLVVTGLFITTTLVFGWAELVGHFLLHMILLTFVVRGVGRLTPPVDWFGTMGRRLGFISLHLVAFFGGNLALYYWLLDGR